MDNSILLKEIEFWKSKISPTNPEILELAFFKIFIKFEKFISDIFVSYSVGNKSFENYCPNRKLCFNDEDHLNAILKKENKSFVNHYETVFRLSEHIFVDNPFEIISTDANFCSDILNMKTIRDYIAHESSHSKRLYCERVLNSMNFIKPYEFLSKKKKSTSVSYYTHYVELMKESSEYIIKGPK
jgi:hypothetical protein